MKVSPDNQHPVKVGGEKTKRLSRKNIVIILVFLVICVGGFIGYGLYVQSQAKKHVAWTPYNEEQRKDIKNLNDEADQLIEEGKKEQAIALYDREIKSTNDKKIKSAALLNKAIVFYNNDDLNQALKYTLEAEQFQETWELEKIIAEIYTDLGDKENAIRHYQKSIDVNDERSIMYESDNAYSNRRISELQND